MKHARIRPSRLAPLLATVALVLASGAAAQTYPPSGCELQLSATAVDPGESFVAAACGFEPAARVTFSLVQNGAVTVLGSATADADTEVRAELTIPSGTPLGDAILRARGLGADGDILVLEASLQVGTELAIAESLPDTGFPAAKVALAGVVFAAAGVVLWWTARPRRTRKS